MRHVCLSAYRYLLLILQLRKNALLPKSWSHFQTAVAFHCTMSFWWNIFFEHDTWLYFGDDGEKSPNILTKSQNEQISEKIIDFVRDLFRDPGSRPNGHASVKNELITLIKRSPVSLSWFSTWFSRNQWFPVFVFVFSVPKWKHETSGLLFFHP